MKKYSIVLFVVMLLVLALVGASAYAEGIVTTNPDIYVGEYEHGRIDFSDDKEVLIVFGNASIEASDGVTERGIALTSGGETKYFPATNYDQTNGNFGVALIKSTIPSGDYVATAYAVVGGIVQEGASLSFDFDTTLSASESEITVTANQSVDLKNFITVSDGDKDEIVYTTATEDSVVLSINDGVVSYVSGHGTATITAKHAFSGSSVEFTATVWDKIVPISNKGELSALATLTTADSYAYLTENIEVNTADIVSASGTNVTDTVVPGEFKGTFDGKGFTVGYAWDYKETTRWSATSTNAFGGVFENIYVGATVRNLVVEGMSVVPYDYVSLFAYTNGGLVENCFVKASAFAADGKEFASTRFVFNSQSGEVRDCVFKVESASGISSSIEDIYSGVGLQRFGAGHWYDVAWISWQKKSAWTGGVNYNSPNKPNGQLHNVVYYASTADFIADVGSTYTIATAGSTSADGSTVYDQETDVFTDITEPQTLGSAWAKDSAEGLKLNGEVVLAPNYTFDYVTTDNGSIVFTEVGQTENIKMYFAEEESQYFTMSSADKAVATVTASGKVTAVGVGATTITVRHAFSNKSTTIPVRVVDKVVEIASAEDFAKLDRLNEGAGLTKSTLVRQTTDIVIDDVNELSLYNDGTNNYYTVIPGHWTSSNTTKTGTTAFISTYDGQGYSITVNVTFPTEETNNIYRGFASGLADTGVIRNVVLNQNVTNVNYGSKQFAQTLYGYVDNSFISTKLVANTTGGDSYLRMQFCNRSYYGIVRNTIIDSDLTYNGNATTATLCHQNSTVWENVAAIGVYSHVITTTGKSMGACDEVKLVNVCRYTRGIDNLFTMTGWQVTVAQKDSTSVKQTKYYGTPLTAPQFLGKFVVDSTNKTITMDVDGVDKVIYTAPAN